MTPGTGRDRVFRTEIEPAPIATDADAGAGDPGNLFDNDYCEREDPADGHHVSDHDPPVLTLSK